MALPPSGTTDEAFVREVDEEYRREQMLGIWRRYGRLIVGGVVVALLALAGFLFWQHHRESNAGVQGEQFDLALQKAEGAPDQAATELAKIAKEGGDTGYAAIAKLAEGGLLLQKNNARGAAAKFAEVANDKGLAQPFRDLGLIRQTAAEFDTLQPQVVIDRLKDLINPNSPWLGTAGELVASAYLKAGKKTEAGKLYGEIAKSEKVPELLRQRAVQLAGVLGVDAIDQSKETKAQ
ncbi:tetratricopeptide repeat protein [Sphingomonas sp. MMS12-HWE2-04]|uniref:tetratricopeptide repeat protein n=1 Tax=Sphingomonas sp. MMS12-HWE2-04 TaxID=3234199 RepID=UPI00384AFAF8